MAQNSEGNGLVLQVATSLLTPPDEDSPSQMLNKLNDDFLMEIFEHLPLRDLCCAAEVCTKFKSIAGCIFSKKIRVKFAINGFDLELAREDNYFAFRNSFSYSNDFSLSLVKSLFRNFNSYFYEVCMDLQCVGNGYNDVLLKVLATYCSCKTCVIEELMLFGFSIKSRFINSLRPVFARLKRIYLKRGSYNPKIADLFAACIELTQLELEDAQFGNALERKFPKLETIYLIRVKDLSDNTLSRFMQLNGQLKKLYIVDPRQRLSTNIFKNIGSYLLDLEQLSIDEGVHISENVEQSLKQLSRLSNLKKLDLKCSGVPAQFLLEALTEGKVSIENLWLTNVTLNSHSIDSLSKLNQIKKLLIRKGSVESGQLMKCLMEMPALKELCLFCCGQFSIDDIKNLIEIDKELIVVRLSEQQGLVVDENVYGEIARSVEMRKSNVKLELTIWGQRCELNVSKRIVEQNCQRLKIEIKQSERKDGVDYSDDDDDFDDDSDDDSDDDFDGGGVNWSPFLSYLHQPSSESDPDSSEEIELSTREGLN